MISPIKHIDRVEFHYLSKVRLEERKKLRKYLLQIASKETKKIGRLDYIFCTDQYLLKINQQYLKHDDLTDIISFDLSETNKEIVGEIYISIERVKENASLYTIPLRIELHRVIFHGLLHLCGYKDKSSKDTAVMREKEDHYLTEYFENQ